MRFEWEGVLNDPIATTPGTDPVVTARVDCAAFAPRPDLDGTSDKCLVVPESNV